MSVSITRLAETLLAVPAIVRLLRGVNSQVVLHIRKLWEAEVAVVAMKFLAHSICFKIHVLHNSVVFHLDSHWIPDDSK